MKTLLLENPGELRFMETAAPGEPGEGEALVRVHRVGVCGTDLHAYRGKQPFFSYPRILGHELGVEVVAVGRGVTNVKVGDRCSVEPYVNCQKCIACRRGFGNCCVQMRVIGVHTDGGMREMFVLPARKLHPAESLGYEQLALVETLAIGAHAVARAEVTAGEAVLVIGAGPIGLSVIQFVQAAGGRAIVMDVSEQRLAFCREQLRAKETINAGKVDGVEAVRELTGGDMATAVLDATGNAGSMCGALKFLSHGGRLVYVGLFQGDFTLNDPEFHKRETTLLATRNALPQDFRNIIELVQKGVVDTRPWITHRSRMERAPAVFGSWTQPETGVLKAVIEI